MSAPKIPLNSEIDALNEVAHMTKTTFHQHCTEMIKDIIAYSPDSYGDLSRLKTQMSKLAEFQKEISGMIYGANEINAVINGTNVSEAAPTLKFEELVDEFKEENDIEDEQQEILSSLDSFINDDKVDQELQIDGDSDLLVTKAVQSYIDPLTQQLMKDPVKSKICNHAYEKESIMAYLGESKKKCPYSGCKSMLGRKDLVGHFVLKMKLCTKDAEF